MLGYAGLIPFVGLPGLATFNLLGLPEVVAAFSAYAAVILSFFGGIHWLQSIQDSDAQRAILAMLPSIVAWSSLVLLESKYTLICLLIAFVLVWMYDHKTLQISRQYMGLRTQLTAAVMGCHLWVLWLVW